MPRRQQKKRLKARGVPRDPARTEDKVSRTGGPRRNCEAWAAFGMGIVALLLWTRLSEWRFGPNDPLSSLGLVIIAAVVAVGLLVDWLQDWRMLRTLRRHLAKTAARARHLDGQRGWSSMATRDTARFL